MRSSSGPSPRLLDVEDRPEVAHHSGDGRQHQLGAVVEVAVHRPVRHTGPLGDDFDGRFVVAFVGQLDQRVEDGVLVALATGGASVDDQSLVGSFETDVFVESMVFTAKRPPDDVGVGCPCASPGARTLNQWIKSPLLYH